jgi:uncharacterized protein (DUF1684 family)
MKKRFGILLGAFVFFVSFALAQTEYVKSIEKWRSDEERDLKKEDGWLTLAGLFWLKDGVNTVGVGSDFDVRLTNNFKGGKFGEITFKDGMATLKVEEGVEAQGDDKNVTNIQLVSDEEGKPTKIRTGTQTLYMIKREDRYGIRLKDSNSKARLNFKGSNWFPVDETYKVKAQFEASPEAKEVMIPNVMGGFFKMKSPGMLKFNLKGKDCSLQPVEDDDGTLFIIFHDRSNETDTYKAGRFLHADKAVNGETVLDFNKAENPPCAFTSFATCPLPPPQNDLEVEVKAGEKRYDH